MSFHDRRLSFTKRAQRDLRNIQIYTVQTWGIEQADAYESALTQIAELLLASPELGSARDDLGQGIRSALAELHILYYRVRPNEIQIVRIFHERADATRAFSDR